MSSKSAFVSAVCAVLLAACGGGSSPSAPSPPTPPPSGGPAPSACSALGVVAPPSLAIVNGSECSPATSPVVLLNMRNAQGFALGACSGTLIMPRAILTAAHCLDEEVAAVRVWLGSGNEIVAQSFSFHPSYRRGGSSAVDVGIVLMAEDLPRTPMPLLTSRDAARGEAAVIAGWGRDQQSVGATLRAGRTTITAVGSFLLETQFTTTASSICLGDSGGPILVTQDGRWAIAGVSSAASVETCNAGTNFYVNLRNSSASSFILDLVPGAGAL